MSNDAVKTVVPDDLSNLMTQLHETIEKLYNHIRMIDSLTSRRMSFGIPLTVISDVNLIAIMAAQSNLNKAERMARLHRERLEMEALKWLAAEREWKFQQEWL